jgi:hypothetical protein
MFLSPTTGILAKMARGTSFFFFKKIKKSEIQLAFPQTKPAHAQLAMHWT